MSIDDIYFAHPEWLLAIPMFLILFITITVKSKQPLPSLSKWLNNFMAEVV